MEQLASLRSGSNSKAMIYLFLLFFEVGLLFILSRIISKTLSGFLSIRVLSLIFLPGVIVHELSHALSASILFVRVGDIDFTPKVENRELKLGRVAIAKTDPVRRAIIGFAPVFVGVLLILGIVYFLSGNLMFFQASEIYITISAVFGIAYILFVISNTMFSSKADMEGTLELLAVFLVIFTAAYFAGFRFPSFFIKSLFSNEIVVLVQKSCIFLAVPIAIDLTILGIFKMLADSRR